MIIDPGKIGDMTKSFVDIEVIKERIQTAIDKGYKSVIPQPEHDRSLLIVAGAPNVVPYYDKIYELASHLDHDLVAINGMLDILVNRKLIPQYMVIVDPQDKHARYLRNPPTDTVYIVASHCSPLVFKALENRKVKIFHAAQDGTEIDVLNNSGKPYFICSPGCTGGLAAFTLGHVLGYRTFHFFGFDGSVGPSGSHVYGNTVEDLQETVIGDRIFIGPLWGVVQMYDFQTLCSEFPGVNIHMYGDGMLPHTFNIMKQENASKNIELEMDGSAAYILSEK